MVNAHNYVVCNVAFAKNATVLGWVTHLCWTRRTSYWNARSIPMKWLGSLIWQRS